MLLSSKAVFIFSKVAFNPCSPSISLTESPLIPTLFKALSIFGVVLASAIIIPPNEVVAALASPVVLV